MRHTDGHAQPSPRARSERGTFAREPTCYGRSAQGRPLEVWLPDGTVETIVIAALHGEEPETTVLLSSALRTIAPDELRAAVVLAANPDGLTRGTRANARGVDLNRNFAEPTWDAAPAFHRWTRSEPQDVRLGCGEAPGSEPETQALSALVARLAPRFVVALHAPLAYVGDPELSALSQQIADDMRLPLVPQPAPLRGSLDGWARSRGFGSITVELPVLSKDAILRSYLDATVRLLATRPAADDAPQAPRQITGQMSGSA